MGDLVVQRLAAKGIDPFSRRKRKRRGRNRPIEGVQQSFQKATANDGKVWYQGEHVIKPGDIILMHFRKRFPDDFIAILRAIHRAGLTPALLEDYIP